MTYETVWVCQNCRAIGRLPFGDTFFAPDVCPTCGSRPKRGWKWALFDSKVARLAWRPRGLNIFRWRWVTPEGAELDRSDLVAEADDA